MDNDPPEYESDLVDLGTLRITQVLEIDESVLAHALRRVQDEADHPEDVMAGWSSAI
jgi:FXSXX-COOH protein